MSGLQLQKAAHGRWHGAMPEQVFGLCTNSADVQTGDIFLALRGCRFDGHRFGADAAKRGAIALLGDHQGIRLWEHIALPQMEVDDTLYALGDIAAARRVKLNAKIIAITGSYGKTTVRSMLQHALTRLGKKVAANRNNDNNLIGVPQTLLAIPEDADIALIECGISETGEMTRLAAMVHPDICVITGFSAAHGEGLGGISGIVQEKSRMLASLNTNGWCALGTGVADMLDAQQLLPRATSCLDMDTNLDDVIHGTMQGCTLHLQYKQQIADISLPLPATHWGANMALVASIVCRLTQTDLTHVAQALADWQPVSGRMQSHIGTSGAHILDDTYNANPASMAAALDTLRALPGRHLAVLGDMAELGDDVETLHEAVDLSGVQQAVLVGTHIHVLHNKYEHTHCVDGAEEAIKLLYQWHLTKDDVVLIKGSHSIGLNQVVDFLKEYTNAV